MPSHYNKRTGEDYLDAEHKRRHKKQQEKFQKAVLKGPGAKMKPIGKAPNRKSKLTPMKKKKKK